MQTHTPTLTPVALLKPHPQNYREHPHDQLEHIAASIRENGFYRNVIAARDGTILAGHGAVAAAKLAGLTDVPVVRLDVDPTSSAALKVLAGDNEVANRAIVDDNALIDLLSSLDVDDLLGTGFDEQMLAALSDTVAPAEGVGKDYAAAEQEWVGMPAYERPSVLPTAMITFDTEEDREAFIAAHWPRDAQVLRKKRLAWSLRWPPRPGENPSDLKFVEE